MNFFQQNNIIKGVQISCTPFLCATVKKSLLLVLLFILSLSGFSQKDSTIAKVDSISLPDTSQFKTEFRKKFSTRWHTTPHSPLRATLYSAMLPGAGQVYNGYKKEGSFARKYWKVPVVYAGIATCIVFIDYNTRKYHYYRDQYVAYADDDPNTVATLFGDPADINKVQEQFHRWMDVSYMSLAAVYIFQIIDANVDAHLFYFDVSKDLSLHFHPSFVYAGQIKPAVGLTIGF